jgi:DNA-binding response OmpR family regulator
LIFSQKGYDTRAAYSAEQALEIIAEWPPDLAILDVVLSKMHGIDLAIFLTQKWPNCRIVLFSGQALTSDLLAEAEKKGYTFAILAKPIHPDLLSDRVRSTNRRQRKNKLRNESPRPGWTSTNKILLFLVFTASASF